MKNSQLIAENPFFSPLLSIHWPSLFLSIDILAWDVVFGFVFIFLGLSLRKLKAFAVVSTLMVLFGVLSLIRLIALPLNNMDLRYFGRFGYTVISVITSVILLIQINKMNSLTKKYRLTKVAPDCG